MCYRIKQLRAAPRSQGLAGQLLVTTNCCYEHACVVQNKSTEGFIRSQNFGRSIVAVSTDTCLCCREVTTDLDVIYDEYRCTTDLPLSCSLYTRYKHSRVDVGVTNLLCVLEIWNVYDRDTKVQEWT